jgi:hypothetical protein
MEKILILEANPQKDLSLNEEIRDLEEVINRSRDREQFEIKTRLAVRSIDLQESILDFQPNIIHFCGHGTGEEGLVFRDKKIETDALSNLFELFKEHLKCVVLNACYSEVQANEIVKHIDYVIGMNQAIRDDAAIAFSIGFYRALGYGRSIKDAFKFGKNAIQLAIGTRFKSRDLITEEMRKLLPVGEVSETIITQEHLKPVLKLNPDLSSISPLLDLSELSREELLEALLDAYRDRNSLKRMVKFKLGKNLNEITSDTLSLHEIIFDLIDWAESNGQLEFLITSVCKDKPNNPKLKKIADRYIA